jgi:hypothetical protein
MSLVMRGRRVLVLSCAILMLSACTHRTNIKSVNTGMPGQSTIRGSVRDVDGSPIENVRIALNGPALNGARETVTDPKGYYHLSQLPSGQDYELTVNFPNYAPNVRRGIELMPWSALNLNFSPSSHITVISATAPNIDYNDAGATSIYLLDPRTGESK